ncbi:MAG: NAD(P)-binding domain-containing protein [Alphaproteobacteria bacterium]|nr:NAD(P)-binding domain-containing protein [Alphaproteobacteria bacterium]
MEPRTDRILVIGAGPVGLAVAKALKDRAIPYDQVDADGGVGGNWRHGVWNTAHIISSRRTTEYADFPMPESYPDFPSRRQMLDYLESYARVFGLIGAIEFRSKVVEVRPVEANLWHVRFEDGRERRYKGVAVCNGHHWDRRWPDYPGQFTGLYMHSKDFKEPDQFRGKRVLVIGGGNSACDVASEAARVGRSCDLSLRRGYWFMPKTLFGVPTVELIRPWIPVAVQRLLLKAALRIVVGPYARYGLPEPDHDIFEHHPTINSELLHYIKHGRVQPRPDIRRFVGRRVEFVDGTAMDYDVVVCATGYHVRLPFLPDGLVEVKGAVPQVYGGSMLENYRHLYIVGWAQVRYGFGPLVTPAAELLALMIELQDGLAHPLGRVLKAMGERPPRSHLIDPHAALRRMQRVRRYFPLLAWRAKRALDGPPSDNPVLEPAKPLLNRPLTVY